MDWLDICRLDELPEGGHREADLDGTAIVVFRLAGELHALEDVCSHDGGRLTGGCVEGDQIVCPRHGARFSIRTGAALTAPAYEPTSVFPVRVVDGRIQVRDDRWD